MLARQQSAVDSRLKRQHSTSAALRASSYRPHMPILPSALAISLTLSNGPASGFCLER